MSQEKILIIEDEKKIARFLELELEYEGYEVELAYDGREGLKKALKDESNLIILDLMLPELSGIEVCRRIRNHLDVPIIMLTAKDDISDKVLGLDLGADDYMTKPFAIEELLARIRANIRKLSNKNKDTNKNILEYKNLKLYKDTYKVEYKEDEIELTKKEFELLEYLMTNKNIVLSRDKILENVWGYDYYGETNLIDVYIRYLRSKIDQKYDVDIIKTVRGVGYIIRD